MLRSLAVSKLEMSKVVPVPGPKFFLIMTSTKIFSEQDQYQSLFLDQDHDQNIFDWDRYQNLFLKGPGPRLKTFSRRDRDQNQIFFLTGTGTKNFFSPAPGPGPKMTGPAHV
jgi:hypothetical protein